MALIAVLVSIPIIGILAAIAIPAYQQLQAPATSEDYTELLNNMDVPPAPATEADLTPAGTLVPPASPAVVSSSTGWMALDNSDGRRGYTTYADPATIRKNGDKVKMQVLRDFKTPQATTGDKPYLSQNAQSEYDCKEEQVRIPTVTLYSGNMGGGDVVYINSAEPSEWSPVSPGSIGELWWKFACGKQ